MHSQCSIRTGGFFHFGLSRVRRVILSLRSMRRLSLLIFYSDVIRLRASVTSLCVTKATVTTPSTANAAGNGGRLNPCTFIVYNLPYLIHLLTVVSFTRRDCISSMIP